MKLKKINVENLYSRREKADSLDFTLKFILDNYLMKKKYLQVMIVLVLNLLNDDILVTMLKTSKNQKSMMGNFFDNIKSFIFFIFIEQKHMHDMLEDYCYY